MKRTSLVIGSHWTVWGSHAVLLLLTACNGSPEADQSSRADERFVPAQITQERPQHQQAAAPDTVHHLRRDKQRPQSPLPVHLRARVQKNGKWGIIKPDGQWVLPPRYEFVSHYDRATALVEKNGEVGYVDTAGRYVIGPRFKARRASPREVYASMHFQQGMAVAYGKNGKCGYINRQGRFVIPPVFDFAWGFSEKGVALVKKEDKLGFIDTSGRFTILPVLEGLEYKQQNWFVRDSLEPAQMGGDWGYLDAEGNWQIEPQFERAEPFYEGYAVVEEAGRLGYINHEGEFFTWLNFRKAQHFSEGLAAVKIGQRWSYIDTTGRVVIFPRYEEAHPFKDSLARVREQGQWGLIHRDGSYRIPPAYDSLVYSGQHTLLPFQHQERWGLVRKDGQVVQQPEFADVRLLDQGYYAVHKPWGEWGLLGPGGQLLTPMKYAQIGEIESEAVAVKEDSLWGYIDRRGNWLLRPRFQAAGPFEDPR